MTTYTPVDVVVSGTRTPAPVSVRTDTHRTRLYLSNAAAPYTPATKRGSWDVTGGAVGKLGAPAGASATSSGTPAAAPEKRLLGRWISDGFPTAGTISGATANLSIGSRRNTTAVSVVTHVHIYVTQGDSDTPRGTLLADANTLALWGSTAAGRGQAFPLSTLAVQVGDRLVVEVGYSNTAGTGVSCSIWYGATGTTDMSETDTAVTTDPGWVEFWGMDSVFAYPGSVGLSGSGALVSTGTPLITAPTALAGSGALGVAGSPSVPGAASLAGSGAFSDAGGPLVSVPLALSGAGALLATGVVDEADHADLTGAGTLTGSGVPKLSGTLGLAGSGALAPSGSPLFTDSTPLGGSSAFLSTATPVFSVPLPLGGSGALSQTGIFRPVVYRDLTVVVGEPSGRYVVIGRAHGRTVSVSAATGRAVSVKPPRSTP